MFPLGFFSETARQATDKDLSQCQWGDDQQCNCTARASVDFSYECLLWTDFWRVKLCSPSFLQICPIIKVTWEEFIFYMCIELCTFQNKIMPLPFKVIAMISWKSPLMNNNHRYCKLFSHQHNGIRFVVCGCNKIGRFQPQHLSNNTSITCLVYIRTSKGIS